MLIFLLCMVLGVLLPIILMGISLSTVDKNEKYVYYAVLAIIALAIKLIWGGKSKGINIALIIVVAGVGFVCYKAQDRVLETLSRVKDIFIKYMEAINKMNLGIANPEDDIAYSLSMKGILNLSFKIVVILLLLSAIGFIEESNGFALTLGVVLYIAIMHGFILRDEVLIASLESIRRAIKVRLKLLDDATSYEDEIKENEEIGDYVESQKSKSSSRKLPTEDTDDEDDIPSPRNSRQSNRNHKRTLMQDEDDQPPSRQQRPPRRDERVKNYLDEEDEEEEDDYNDDEYLSRRRPGMSRQSIARQGMERPDRRNRPGMERPDRRNQRDMADSRRSRYEEYEDDERMSRSSALGGNRRSSAMSAMYDTINQAKVNQSSITARRRHLDDDGNEI